MANIFQIGWDYLKASFKGKKAQKEVVQKYYGETIEKYDDIIASGGSFDPKDAMLDIVNDVKETPIVGDFTVGDYGDVFTGAVNVVAGIGIADYVPSEVLDELSDTLDSVGDNSAVAAEADHKEHRSFSPLLLLPLMLIFLV